MKNIRLEYGRFAVWQYQRPSGHYKSAGFLRGTSVPITEWAFALVDESSRPLVVYDEAHCRSGFESAEAAIVAARAADWERATSEQRAVAVAVAKDAYQRQMAARDDGRE